MFYLELNVEPAALAFIVASRYASSCEIAAFIFYHSDHAASFPAVVVSLLSTVCVLRGDCPVNKWLDVSFHWPVTNHDNGRRACRHSVDQRARPHTHTHTHTVATVRSNT